MTLEDMIKCFNDRGFYAKQYYDLNTNTYVFNVGKHGRELVMRFRYPHGPDAHSKQKAFIDEMIQRFNNNVIQKEKELNMNNLSERIEWKVRKTTIDRSHRSESSGINVEIEGFAKDGYTFGCPGPYEMDLLANALQKKLNEPETNIQMEVYKYITNDLAGARTLYNRALNPSTKLPEIKKVIFNNPATIVIWTDGTKTIVKCQNNETYDPEKGLAMAITKKALGNEGNYFEVIKKWVEKCDVPSEHSSKWLATQRLHNALNDKKATKADLIAAMNEAINYLDGTDS